MRVVTLPTCEEEIVPGPAIVQETGVSTGAATATGASAQAMTATTLAIATRISEKGLSIFILLGWWFLVKCFGLRGGSPTLVDLQARRVPV